MSSVPRRGLGRGFEVLIGGAAPELAHVAVDQIHPNPNQPRKRFESEGVTGLAESIKAQGLIQPVVLRPRLEGGYELIAGERRWRAAREAGIATVPAVVREADDRDTLLLGLVENVAREDLSPIEEARAFARADRRVRPRRSARSPSASAARSRRSRTGSACSSCPRTCWA